MSCDKEVLLALEEFGRRGKRERDELARRKDVVGKLETEDRGVMKSVKM